nr:GIY-YIG nuclease family protein [Candidatus Levybacteria bacterium]
MNNQIYIGSTKDLRKRLKDHNSGKEISTKRYLPWRLIYYEAFIEEKLARIREHKLKHNGNALRELKKRIGLLNLLNTTFSSKLNKSDAGFTLIEILVVLVMLSAFLLLGLLALDPVAQFDKAKDAQRKHDFEEINNALDTYYNDNSCYPTQSQNLPFGLEWKDSVSGVVYMKKVPQDPDCSKTGYCYVYQTDANTCPQWGVLWTRFSRPTDASRCLIQSACGTNPNPQYNYCVMSGNINCLYIQSNPL